MMDSETRWWFLTRHGTAMMVPTDYVATASEIAVHHGCTIRLASAGELAADGLVVDLCTTRRSPVALLDASQHPSRRKALDRQADRRRVRQRTKAR